VMLLLARGAQINARDSKGNQAIHYAIREARDSDNLLDMLRFLSAAGVNLDARNDEGHGPLYFAVDKHRLDAIKFLLEHHVSLDDSDEHGSSLLQKATKASQPDMVALLLAAGAPVGHASKGGYQALHNAALRDTPKIVSQLLAAGADVNAANELGQQPIHLAVEHGNTEVVKILLAAGARADIRDKEGESAFDYARDGGQPALFKLLLNSGRGIGSGKKRITDLDHTVIPDTAACYASLLGTFKITRKSSANGTTEVNDNSRIIISRTGSTYFLTSIEADGTVAKEDDGQPHIGKMEAIPQKMLHHDFVGSEKSPESEAQWRLMDTCALIGSGAYISRVKLDKKVMYSLSAGGGFGGVTAILEKVK
jgi:hypothetical protein